MSLGSSDSDNRPLSRPIAVVRNGRETSISTIAGAIKFLTSDLKDLATTVDWQLAIDALGDAHRLYTRKQRELATHLVEKVYRHAQRR